MQCQQALELLSGHIDNTNTEEQEAMLQEHLLPANTAGNFKAYEWSWIRVCSGSQCRLWLQKSFKKAVAKVNT